MKSLGKGDPYKVSGDPIDLGLNEQYACKDGTKMKLRGETDEGSQRPTRPTESIKSDRGTFKHK